MASRRMENKSFHLEDGLYGLVQLFGQVTVTGNATPASSTATTSSKGFASASRTGTGEYTLVLEDKWAELHAAQLSLQAAAALTTGQSCKLKSFDLANKQVVVEFTNELGAAEDLSDGEVAVLHFHLALKG